MSIGLAVGALQNVINLTNNLISDIEGGQEPPNAFVLAWQSKMYELGLIPNPDNFNNPDGGGVSGNAGVDYSVIANLIGDSTNTIISTLEGVNRQALGVIVDQQFSHTASIRNDIQDSAQALASYIDGFGDVIIGGQLQLADTINNSIQNIGSGIEGIVVDAVYQAVGNLNIDQGRVLDEIQGVEARLAQAIESVGINSGGGGSGSGSSTDISGYMHDLTFIMIEILDAIRLMELDPTINNNITFGGDSSASTGLGGGLSLENVSDILALINGDIAGAVGGLLGSEIEGISLRTGQLADLVGRLLSGDIVSYDDFIIEFNDLFGSGLVVDNLVKVVMALPVLVSSILSVASPFVNNVETLARTKALDGLLSVGDIRELWIRQIFDVDKAREELAKLGFNHDEAFRLFQTAQVQLQDYNIREAYLRDFIDEDLHDELMMKLGYKISDLDLIKRVYTRIPPVPDLIRFAVREAYDDDLADVSNLDEGYDSIKSRFEKDLRQNGLDESYGKLYWRSHWNLPSPTQGYEMLHRGKIEEDELRQLLKISDYAPAWIQNLIDIAYSPYTRVDIRRMHKVGELTDQGVYEAYKDIGYNHERATKLMGFTVKLNQESTENLNKDLTTSQALRAYVNGIITEAEVDGLLQQIGYNPVEARILKELQLLGVSGDDREDVVKDNKRRIVNSVSKAYIEGKLSEQTVRTHLFNVGYDSFNVDIEINALKVERSVLLQEQRIDHIFKEYVEFRMGDSEVRTNLAREGYTPIEENDILVLWNSQRKKRYKDPTKAELKKWFVAGDITQGEYRDYLYGMQYDSKLADLYIEDALRSSVTD